MGRRTREKPVGAVPDRVEKGSITGRGWGIGIGQTQDARVHVAASVPARMLSGTGRDGMCRGRYPLQRNGPFPHPPGLRPRLLLPTATGCRARCPDAGGHVGPGQPELAS